jgi:hypothetical protein
VVCFLTTDLWQRRYETPNLYCAPPPTLAGKFRERKAIGQEKLRIYDHVRGAKVAALSLYEGYNDRAGCCPMWAADHTAKASGSHAAAGVDMEN